MVTAHEVGVFVFCPEQWRLEYGLGLQPGNRTMLEAGSRHHARKAKAERTAGQLLRLGRGLLLGALILLVFWVLGR